MNESVFRIKDIFVYGFGLLTVFSYLWGAFVFYKKAIESHFEDLHILDAVVVAAFWAFMISRVIFVLFNWNTFGGVHLPRVLLISDYPGLDRWGAVMGIALGVWLSVRRIKARFLDWFDLVCLGLLAGESVFFGGLLIFTLSFGYLFLAILGLVCFMILWQVEDRYRTYGWYRGKRTSARSGLITGFTLAFWGLSFLIQKILFKELSWSVAIWITALFVGGLLLVYIRSGRTVADDIKNIFKTKHARK